MARSALMLVGLVACSDAVTLEIAGDRPVPTAIDAVCVGIADTDPGGGQFGAIYRLEGDLGRLPQTLRIEAGGASSAWAWVRGDRGGVGVARSAARVDFSDDVTLSLDRCMRGANGPPRALAIIGASGRLVASQGQGGSVAVVIGTQSVVLDAREGTLVITDAPVPPGPVLDAIAADLDGDCDDDVIVATASGSAIWLREGATFVDAGALVGADAIAAADVDRDGDVDLVIGRDAGLSLWLNDGAGGFSMAASALSSAGRVTAVGAVALGDLDGDGNADLVVGQRVDAPLVAWLGDPDGAGSFRAADAVVPPVPLAVARMTLADADGDFDPDLAVAFRAQPMRLYIDRDGRLEDQTFVRVPQPAPIARSVAFGGWDAGCEPDALIAGAASAAWSGTPTGEMVGALEAPAADDTLFIDLDDDGDLDALFATAEGIQWYAR